MSNRKRKNDGDNETSAAAKTSKKSIADYFNMEGSDGLKKIVNVCSFHNLPCLFINLFRKCLIIWMVMKNWLVSDLCQP